MGIATLHAILRLKFNCENRPIAHISTAGSVLRIELQHQLSNQLMHVELPRSQERFLHLTTGAQVFAKPTNSKVFLE